MELRIDNQLDEQTKILRVFFASFAIFAFIYSARSRSAINLFSHRNNYMMLFLSSFTYVLMKEPKTSLFLYGNVIFPGETSQNFLHIRITNHIPAYECAFSNLLI